MLTELDTAMGHACLFKSTRLFYISILYEDKINSYLLTFEPITENKERHSKNSEYLFDMTKCISKPKTCFVFILCKE